MTHLSHSSEDGRLLGECLDRQPSPQFGGVIPSITMGMHRMRLPRVVGQALRDAGIDPEAGLAEAVAAVAVTTRPGLSGSLS